MKRVLELRAKRANLIDEARKIHEAAPAEGMGAEDTQRFDQLMDEAEKLNVQIQREERLATATADLDDDAAEARGNGRPDQNGGGQGLSPAERQMRAFRRYFAPWLTQNFRDISPTEMRALQAELDTAGGYLRPPQQFVNDLIKAVDDQVFVRRYATKFQVPNAESLGVPTLENDPADANWTSELATGSEDSTMSLGKRELHPHPLAKRLKISRKLMRAVPSAENLARDRLAYKFGITEEKGFLTGPGAQQPLGVFVASNDGIPTTQDVSTSNTTTAITADGLINAKFKLKGAYWPNARWLFHRDAVKQIALLKDGEGRYMWQMGLTGGTPDTLLDRPVDMSEYAPNTFTASQYVGLFCDWRNYWIADAMDLEFQLLQELYAESNQVGLIGRLECDGMPVLAEAFVRVQLAAG